MNYNDMEEKNRIIEEEGLYLEEPNKDEDKKKYLIIIILTFVFIGLTAFGTYAFISRNSKLNYLNIDINGDGICDVNCTKSSKDKKPYYNISYKGKGYYREPLFNLDTNGDGIPDTNLIDQDLDGDGKCDLNCDTDGDGWPESNLDFDGDGKCDLNCDTNKDGKCDLNCDIDDDKKCNYNCDTNGDGKCDLNCDTNKDGKCDLNCDTDGDGKCDLNCDTDGDGKCDLNCDTTGDGKCNLNCDTNKDGKCNLNCDTDGDGKCDLNCDTDKDGKCDLNCDTDGDGKCNLNCDTDGDGKCDKECDTDGDGKCDKNCSDVDIKEDTGTYVISILDDTTINNLSVRPGWKASNKFTIKNTSGKTLIYDIYWSDISNNFTIENNLYFGLTRNNNNIIDINTNRTPYPKGGVNQSLMVSNVEIKSNETHEYILTLWFKETNKNQDMDRGKEFVSKIKIVNKGIKGE